MSGLGTVVRPRSALFPLALTCAAGAAYSRTFSAPFIFDDIPSIVDNPSIRHLGRLGAVLWPPTGNGNGVGGRPLVNLSLALNYAISSYSVWSYHAFNLAIHLLAGLTLFGLLRRTFAAANLSPARPLAFAAALLWIVHPLLTESVTCVVQRTESLMGLLYLFTLYAFVRRWFVLATLSCLLGMATKEAMATAPLVVLLYDRTFLAGTFREAWRARKKAHLGLASTWLLLAGLVFGAGGSRGPSAGFGLGVSPWRYLLTQCRAIVHYLRLCFWPHPLVVDYGSGVVSSAIAVLPQAVLLVALLALSGYAWLRATRPLRAAGFAGLCFFILLAPSSSVVPLVTQTVAEHRMYLPLALVLAVVVVTGRRLLAVPRVALPCLLGLAVAEGALTIRRNADYRSALALWSVTVAQEPDNARAHVDLGNARFQRGEVAESIRQYQQALALDPRMADAHYNLGVALIRQGQTDPGVGELRKSLEFHPNAWVAEEANYDLATTLARDGRYPEAIPAFQSALEINPRNAQARTNLATALLQSGRLDEAFAEYRIALAAEAGSAIANFNYANLLAQKGRFDEALAYYRRALAADPAYAKAHCNLGSALVQLGRLGEAVPEYREALRLNPALAEARNNLARVEAYLRSNR